MKLQDYLYFNKISQTDFAKDLRISRKTFFRILKGHDLKLTLAMDIQQKTKNKVTTKDLLDGIDLTLKG